LSTKEVVGISAGIIAAIVIAIAVAVVLVAVGSKKGYDYYRKRIANMELAANNPLYSDGGLTGTNPLHER
jgi:hypothetical protein